MENSNKNNIFIYLLVVFFALFIGTSIFLVLNNNKINKTSGNGNAAAIKTEEKVAPTEIVPSEGSLSWGVLPEKLSMALPVDISLTASSNGKNIVGYDLILSYDPSSFNFVKATSLIPDFQIYTYKKDNYVEITAVKGSQSQNLSVFENTKLISFTFQPKKTGQGKFSLFPSLGAEKTKLVTDKTEVLIPKIDNSNLPVTIY